MSAPSPEIPQIAWDDLLVVNNTKDPIRNGRAEAGFFFETYHHPNEFSMPFQWLSWEAWTRFLSKKCGFSTTEHLLKCTIEGESTIYIFDKIQWKSALSSGKKHGKKIVFEIISMKETYAKLGYEPPGPKPAVVGPRSPVFGDSHRSLFWRGVSSSTCSAEST